MQIPTKFTQEIKDNWLANLKSGKYVQGFDQLHYQKDNSFCCIGALGDCTPGLEVCEGGKGSPYEFLNNTIGIKLCQKLWATNDEGNPARDYSNVIPLIESLPAQE